MSIALRKILIVGAGISGVSISRMLSGKFNVEILERSNKPGGLIRCDRIHGSLFHRVGGHVFNSRNNVVLDWFWKHFDKEKEFLKASRNAKIFLGGKYVGYPIENYLYQLPEEQIRRVLDDLLSLMSEGNKSLPDNFKDFLINSFGETLYELYFGPYNSKLWNTDISKVPLEWLEGKLPMPSKNEIIISNILRKEESSMVHASFYYPKMNGSQFIIDRLAEGQEITLDYHVSSILKDEKGRLVINNEKTADHLVYCGDVRKLDSIIHFEDDQLRAQLREVKNLASNGTSNVLCETDDNNISWLYIPDERFKAHRIIYTGNFSDTNNDGSGRKTCVVEFSGKQSEESMVDELKHLPGNLKAMAFNYEPDSYIIHDSATGKKISALRSVLAEHNIHLLGRFAEWEYYNMDKCIESAMRLSEKMIAS